MEDSTAEGIAGAGALLAAVSLALPWYSVGVSDELAARLPAGAPSLGSQSGWEALGGWHWVVVALALLAGWSGARRLAPALPLLAAGGLVVLAGYAFVAPPGVGELLADQLPAGSAGPLGAAVAEGFVKAFTDQLGLVLEPALGIGLAAAGGGAAVVAGLSRA